MSDNGQTVEGAATDIAVQAYTALLDARQAIGTTVNNDGTNPHFRSSYPTLEAVLNAVEPVLMEHGFVLSQVVETVEEGPVLITNLIHAPTGYRINGGGYPLICAKEKDPQALGSAMTYARRYTVMALMGLAPTDDDGERATQRKKPAKKAPAAPRQEGPKPSEGGEDPDSISDGKRKRLYAIAHGAGWGDEEMKDELNRVFGYTSTKMIPWRSDTYDKIVAHFEAGPAFKDDLGEEEER